jgi:uncharacterized protein (TIGR00162 family)
LVLIIETSEQPKLRDPVLIGGLPGIGFVANIAALHLIKELRAKRFAQLRSSSFQDLAVTAENGTTRFPINELYYYHNAGDGRDLIIWYGNTQALTTAGQYELCGRILDTVRELGCRLVITLGGFRQDEVKSPPQIYVAATDVKTLNETLQLGTKIMVGQIFGVAGLLIGLSALRDLKGFSLLVETLGNYPDANAAQEALLLLNEYLRLNVDVSRMDQAAEETKKILESFGLIRNIADEKKREEQKLRWFI